MRGRLLVLAGIPWRTRSESVFYAVERKRFGCCCSARLKLESPFPGSLAFAFSTRAPIAQVRYLVSDELLYPSLGVAGEVR